VRCKTFGIETETPTRLVIDGENTAQTPLQCRVLPLAFQLFVPASTHAGVTSTTGTATVTG
jgi:diacylglycerol kinase family enzyme